MTNGISDPELENLLKMTNNLMNKLKRQIQ